MSNIRKRKMKINRQDGFTLIELLLVVLILGILAAVVIPQFGSSSQDAKISALKSNLGAVRQALELYALQHNGNYPDASDDATTFVNKLTLFSKTDGTTSDVDRANFPLGPYIKTGMPANPMVDDASADAVYIDTSVTGIGTFVHSGAGEGWHYKTLTGEFVANQDAYDQY